FRGGVVIYGPRVGIRFVYFDDAIGGNVLDGGCLPAAPDDLHVQEVCGTAARENAHGGIAGNVPAAADHFLRLPHGTTFNNDLRPDALSIRWKAIQADGKTGGARFVAVEECLTVENAHHDIEVTVVV